MFILFALLAFTWSAYILPEQLNECGQIKIGIYSGTFDPPTKAHNSIIRNAIEFFKLDKLYIFVNNNKAKYYKCSSQQRLTMLTIMLEDIKDKVIIITQSSKRKADDYLFMKKIISEKMIQITGYDSYERRLLISPENRIQFDALGIIPREGSQPLELESNATMLPLDSKYAHVSSTMVRRKLANREYRSVEVDPGVLGYIVENQLYLPYHKYELYLEKYFNFLGKMLAKHKPPTFDNTASPEAWEENFINLIENNFVILEKAIGKEFN